MGWWVADFWNHASYGPVWVVSWLVWVIVSIVLHELAHGWAALYHGDTTPRDTGHMTWNPLVHMGHFSLIALAVFGIAWGAMPVDPSRMRGRHADAVVSAAGPAMNLLLALIALICLIIWRPLADGSLISGMTIGEPLGGNLTAFFFIGAFINLLLLLFNLLPVMPLDGGRITAHYIRPYREFVQTEHGMWISLGGMLLFFFFAFRFIIPAAMGAIESVTKAAWSVLGV